MSEHIKPCPFCGGNEIQGEQIIPGWFVMHIRCISCAATAGYTPVKLQIRTGKRLWDVAFDEAIKKWNTRTDTSQ